MECFRCTTSRCCRAQGSPVQIHANECVSCLQLVEASGYPFACVGWCGVWLLSVGEDVRAHPLLIHSETWHLFFFLFESSLHTSRLGYGSMFFIRFFLHHPETSGDSPPVLVSCGDPCPHLARLRPFRLPLPFFPPLCGDGIGSRTQDVVILNSGGAHAIPLNHGGHPLTRAA